MAEPEGLQVWRTSVGSGLSEIPEQETIYHRLFVSIIGPAAQDISEALATEAEVEFGLNSKSPAKQKLLQQSPSATGPPEKIPGAQAAATIRCPGVVTEKAPWACRIIIYPPNSPVCLSAERSSNCSFERTSEKASEDYQVVTTKKHMELVAEKLRTSRSPLRMGHLSERGDLDFVVHMVKLCLHPVATFSDCVPVCRAINEWRALTMVFLVDERETSMLENIKDLRRRLFEIKQWVKTFTLSKKVREVPYLVAVILKHEQATCVQQAQEQPTETPKAAAEETKEAEDGEELLQSFVNEVRSAVHAPEEWQLIWKCNFDDPSSLLHTFTSLAASILRGRQGDDHRVVAWESETYLPSACRCSLM